MHPFLFPGMRMGWGGAWLAKSMQPVCLSRNVALQFPDEQWAFDLFVKGRVLHCKTRPFSCQNAAFYSAKGRIWHFILILLVLRSDDGKIPASHQAFCL